jgi:hypothetical protein
MELAMQSEAEELLLGCWIVLTSSEFRACMHALLLL